MILPPEMKTQYNHSKFINKTSEKLSSLSLSDYNDKSKKSSKTKNSKSATLDFKQPNLSLDINPFIDSLLIKWLNLPNNSNIISEILKGKDYKNEDKRILKNRENLGNDCNQISSKSDVKNDNDDIVNIERKQIVQNRNSHVDRKANGIQNEIESPVMWSPRGRQISNIPILPLSESGDKESPRDECKPTEMRTITPNLVSISNLNHQTNLRESFRIKQSKTNKVKSPSQIPKFYFPFGNKSKFKEQTPKRYPDSNILKDSSVIEQSNYKSFSDWKRQQLQKVKLAFESLPGGCIARFGDMDKIAMACNVPIFWRRALFNAVGGHRAGQITSDHFLKFWDGIISNYFDEASKFIAVVSTQRKRNENNSKLNKDDHYLEFNDFMPIIQDVVDTHVGLNFLTNAKEFHSRYVQTVICRIFYHINRSWSGKISIQEMRNSYGNRFLTDLELLSCIDDINQFTWFFSYEHFYVIYCKFWELDKDHDLIISAEDLMEYQDGALTSKIVDRLMSGCVTRFLGSSIKNKTMGYRDFIFFILAENDKCHPTALEYWFRVLDLDGDGILSLYELEYFYEEQAEKLTSLDVEPLNFEDVICLAIDSINCHKCSSKISLSKIKKSKLSGIFLDTFINTAKYLDNEQEEHSLGDNIELNENVEKSEILAWEKYCNEEYLYLSSQEQMAQDKESSD